MEGCPEVRVMKKFYVIKNLHSDLYLEDVSNTTGDQVDNWTHEFIDIIVFSNEGIAWDYIRTVFGSDMAEENLAVVSISHKAIERAIADKAKRNQLGEFNKE